MCETGRSCDEARDRSKMRFRHDHGFEAGSRAFARARPKKPNVQLQMTAVPPCSNRDRYGVLTEMNACRAHTAERIWSRDMGRL